MAVKQQNRKISIVEGSVRQRQNGTYELRISTGKMVNGKPQYKSIYGKTKKELKEKARDYNENQTKFIENVQGTTFQEYALFWMKTYKLPNLKPVSYDRMEQTYKTACNYLGNVQMGNITSEDVQAMINDLAKEKAYSTVKKHFELVNSVFKYSVNSRKLGFNPCAAVELPSERNMKVQTKQAEIFTQDETDAMYAFNMKLKTSRNQFFKHMPAILLMLNTGWRIGELLALEWKDIDFRERQAVISKTLTKAKVRDENGEILSRHKETYADKTKTKSGERITPLNDMAIELLNQIKEYNKRMKIKSDYVVCTSDGGYVSERNLLRTFNSVMGVIGAEKNYTIHSLRHTYASRLLMNGVEISVVSKLLGHADINTTYSKYIHVLDSQLNSKMKEFKRI